MHLSRAETPLGLMRLAADEEELCGLWFEGAQHAPSFSGEEQDDAVIRQAKRWLALYFSGQEPDFTPPLHLKGTAFQRAVWERLLAIPYGAVTTYGALADSIAAECHRSRPAPQAVGQAVGHNPVSLIVPCHRVVGASGKLTGYAGGLARKEALLRLEGADLSRRR